MFIFLWDLLKNLLVVCGILLVIDIMYAIISQPFKEKEKQRKQEELEKKIVNTIIKNIENDKENK